MKLDFSAPPRRTLKVFQPYTGMGKSFAAAEHLAEVANYPRRDDGKPLARVTYAAPSHRVASDMERALASRGVAPENVVHRWSVLMDRVELDGTVIPACQRREEVEALVSAGTGLQPRKVCIRCPFREECPAYAAAKVDDERAPMAAVEIVTHAALGGEAADQLLICDEPPGYLDEVSITSETLAWVRSDQPMSGVLSHEREVARQIARCWLSGRDHLDLPAGYGQQDDDGNDLPRETIGQWLAHRDGAAFDVVNGQDLPRGASAPALAAIRGVRDVLRVASWDSRQRAPRRKGVRELEAALPGAAILRLREQGGILLDGTPWLCALRELFDDLEVHDAPAPDWASLPVTREWRESNAVAKVRLCHSYWDGKRFDDEPSCRRDGETPVPGINWPLIENELRLSLAQTGGTLLFGSFKLVVDVLAGRLQDHVERAGELATAEATRLAALRRTREMIAARGVEMCSFGAARSRNDWKEVRQVLVVGSPFMSAQRTAEALGMSEYAVEPARCEYARGELIQTAERGRSVHRDDEEPLTMTLVCSAKCLPEGWGSEETYDVGAVLPVPAALRAERALWWLGVAVRAHGEPAVRARAAPGVGERAWLKWRSGETDASGVDGLLAEMLPRGLFAEGWSPAREDLPETQAEWRRLLEAAKGQPGFGEWRKKFNVYRTRGRDWQIPLDVGLALERLSGFCE